MGCGLGGRGEGLVVIGGIVGEHIVLEEFRRVWACGGSGYQGKYVFHAQTALQRLKRDGISTIVAPWVNIILRLKVLRGASDHAGSACTRAGSRVRYIQTGGVLPPNSFRVLAIPNLE